MDDNAASTTVVEAVSGNHATASSNTSTLTTTGRVNSALNFNATTVSYPTSNFPIGSGSHTLSMWIYPNQYRGGLFSWGNTSGNQARIFSLEGSGKIAFNGYANDYTSGATVSLNAWSHLLITYDGTTQKIYVNNVLQDSRNISLNTQLGVYIYMGNNLTGNGTYSGKIDDVMLFGRELNQAERAQVYGRGN
jgi:hypothetical protein